MKNLFLFTLLIFSSCESITKFIDSDNYYQTIEQKKGKEHLSLLFSHNLNGELEPCGCRHHPLGGLSQVAGFFHQNQKKNTNFYVDTGDAFFPSTQIPGSMKKSLTFTAHKIAEGFDRLGLKYFVPGDQDFASGLTFLEEVAKKYQFKFLISNLKEDQKIKHLKLGKHRFGKKEFIFIGLVNPSLMGQWSSLFHDPFKTFAQIIKKYPNKKNIIVLSHMGIEKDKELAKKFPQISWIIGAHSQSFLKDPLQVNKTNIVQVLSRNHYLGVIDFSKDLALKEQYRLVEIRDGLADKIKPNPFISFLQEHKKDLNQIQKEEQKSLMSSQSDKTVYQKPTATSCFNCHQEQTHFWQKTAHSLAFHTLKVSQADANPACVKCHSLDFQKETGFLSTEEIVQFQVKQKEKLADHKKKYMQELNKIFKDIKSIRDLKAAKKLKLNKQSFELDNKYKVSHNFSNVQCLNCHDQNIDHPFDDQDDEETKKTLVNTNRCLSCHTHDQSPEWYKKSHPPQIDNKVLSSMLKKVACPKMK